MAFLHIYLLGDCMLKQKALKKIMVSSIALVIMFLFTIFPKNSYESIPEEVIYIDEITMPIYAENKDGYIARILSLKKENDDEIKYIISSLTKDTEESNYLLSGFTPLIPKNTQIIDYTIEDKIIKINFTKELLDVDQTNGEKMLQSLVYSLCELDGIKGVIIYVENTLLDHFPGSNKSLPNILDRNIGINKKYEISALNDTKMTTIYYMGKENNDYYYIPISKISNDSLKPIEVIVSSLKSTPIYETNLISFLNASYELQDYELLENSIKVSFNNKLLMGINESDINEYVKYSLALSLRDTYNIDDIEVNIN